MKRNAFLKLLSLGLFLSLAASSPQLRAQEYILGAHVGGLGLMGDGASSSGVAYGPYMRVNPLGWAAFQLDATFAHFDGGLYFSSSPGIFLYPVATDEFAVGVIFGPGFYKLPGDGMKFGLHVGVGGDFAVSKNLSVGMETRFHPIFQAPDAWSVFVNLGFRFEGSNDW